MKNNYFVLTVVICLINCFYVSATSEVSVPEWLILGPIYSGQNSGLLLTPFIEEERTVPAAGDKAASNEWKKVNSNQSIVNFTEMGFPSAQGYVAYAFTYIYSDDNIPATLLLGSDDGIAVWLNGVKVWNNDIQRGVIVDEDAVHVQLNKGWNRLLLKISQVGGNWGFSCNISVSAALKFSLVNPQPGKWNSVKNSTVYISRLNVTVEDNSGKAMLSATLHNSDENKTKNVTCNLIYADGKKTGDAISKSIMPKKDMDFSFLFHKRGYMQVFIRERSNISSGRRYRKVKHDYTFRFGFQLFNPVCPK